MQNWLKTRSGTAFLASIPGFISLRNNYTPCSILSVGKTELRLELRTVIVGISGFDDEESTMGDSSTMGDLSTSVDVKCRHIAK